MVIDIFNTAKKYNLILADPPWRYGSKGARSGQFGALDYNDMSTDEICQLPVSNLSAKDCALEMWFTASFVEDAIKVCNAWGFKVIRIDVVWLKETVNQRKHGVTGPWGMSDCEFVLLGSKGKACSLQKGKRNMYTSQSVQYPGKHSRKPEHFHELFEDRFHNLPRIELFAREHRNSWDCWGNEV